MRKPLWEVLLEAFVNAERFYCREHSSSVLSHIKGGSCLFVLYIEWATCGAQNQHLWRDFVATLGCRTNAKKDTDLRNRDGSTIISHNVYYVKLRNGHAKPTCTI